MNHICSKTRHLAQLLHFLKSKTDNTSILKMPAIPDRWIEYEACGNVIEGTRFICFKVPLKKSVQTGNPDIKEIWDIPALLSKVPNLGAVIDLTNTMRYYKPAEFKAAGILHKKILIPGRIIPPESSVTEFMNSVDEFLEKDDEFLIGIHCTHGLNRTGYLVCRYMRDRLGIPAKDAINKFERARGYQIERENYKADLLGTPPSAPDFGPHTSIKPFKPVGNKYLPDSRSPLSKEEYYEEQTWDRYNRPDRYKSRGYSYNRYNHDDDGRSSNWRDRSSTRYNWRSKEDNYRTRRKVSRSDSDSSRNSSYDFRYDY